MRNWLIFIFIFIFLLCPSNAFRPLSISSSTAGSQRASSALFKSKRSEPVLTPPEEKVYEVLKEIHESKFSFRVVVVGNGAILESTMILGPTMKVSTSPATGANILTLASEDKSFEFHVETAQVSKIVFTQKESPQKAGRIMNISRLLTSDGKAMCSLILADDTDESRDWYEGLISSYGNELQL
jgi:hypothetical protein